MRTNQPTSTGTARLHRSTLRRSAVLVPALVAALAAPGQCDVEEASQTPAPSAAPSQAAPGSLAEIDPCQLLDETTAPQLGIEDVATGDLNESEVERFCAWETPDYGVMISILEQDGLDTIPEDSSPVPVAVDDRLAIQASIPDGSNNCYIAVGVGAGSRVDHIILGREGIDTCAIAMQAAQLTEPKLP